MLRFIFGKIQSIFRFERHNLHNAKIIVNGDNNSTINNLGNGNQTALNGGTIINSSLPKNAIQDNDNWESLLKGFEPENRITKKIIELVEDPRYKQHLDHNISGYKKNIKTRFEKISPDSKDPSAKIFTDTYQRAIDAIENFVQLRDKQTFLEEWDCCYQILLGLRGN